MEQVRILVVDDEAGICDSLRRILTREGYEVTVTDSGHDALDTVRSQAVDIILADIMMPKMSGIELLRAVKAISPSIEVLMMTAFGTVENAVECMREGAYDFIGKPLKKAIVVRSVQRALERRNLVRENQILRDAVDDSASDLVGNSAAMTQTLAMLDQAARSDATVLLLGESGSGKEVLARHAHKLSDRASAPFVAINCGALPEGLLESELFGHEKGAFTGASDTKPGRFERASGGTIFLDEIGETSPAVQVRLLRVLQEGEVERIGGATPIKVNVRVLAATHRNLEADVSSGRFREDLFYRLNVIPIEVPPLRERHGDVALLAQHFLKLYCEKNKKTLLGISEAALRALDSYDWPGNVRELENCIERAVVLTRNEMLAVSDLPPSVIAADGKGTQSEKDGIYVPFGTPLAEIEHRVIRETLKRTGGDKKTAAHLLGIAARTIYRKLGEEAADDVPN